MTELLCVPLKQTLRLDLHKELSELINSTTYQTSSFFDEDLKKISELREKASDSEVSDKKLAALKEYYVHIGELKKKFPDNQIKFTWFQTLSQKSCASAQYSLQFEMLNILYNIGSMYTLLALNSNDGSIAALKKMCVYFQRASGCFDYIVRHLQETKEPVVDQNTGLALVELMLAQAQECFWLRAVRDSHKNTLISRLAQQTADYYEEALLLSKKSELIRSDWSDHLNSKSMHFKAVAYYRNALSLGQNSEYGAVVKSLTVALTCAKQSSLASSAEFVETIQEALRNAERDNDFIYLQQVPSSLPKVKPAPVVKPLPVEEALQDGTGDVGKLFQALLPLQVIEACTAYTERQGTYISDHIIQPLEALNKILIQNLPKLELPSNVKPISREELHHYQAALQDQDSNYRGVSGLLQQIEAILKKESDTDDYLRNRFGNSRWKLSRSSTVNATYYERLHASRDYLSQGQAIDHETASLFDSIDKTLITANIEVPESKNPAVIEVNKTIQKRENYCKGMEAKASENPLLPKIISEYRKTDSTDFEGVFRDHLKIFDTDVKFVQEQKELNRLLLGKLQDKIDIAGIKRLEPIEIYVEDFRHSLQLFGEVKRNLEEGAEFYQKLVKLAGNLLTEVQEYEAQRREAQRALEAELVG